jgi:hypothetical protein
MITAAFALLALTTDEPPADAPPADATATIEVAREEPASFGFALDLTVGAGLATVNHALYEQVRANTLLPRLGVGTRFHLVQNLVLGVAADASYSPMVSYDVAWGVVSEWADPYASGNADVIVGYHWRSDSFFGVLIEGSAGPSVAYSGGSDVAWGGHAALFGAVTLRFGFLDLAIGPSVRGGWTNGPNLEALVLVRPSLAFGA